MKMKPKDKVRVRIAKIIKEHRGSMKIEEAAKLCNMVRGTYLSAEAYSAKKSRSLVDKIIKGLKMPENKIKELHELTPLPLQKSEIMKTKPELAKRILDMYLKDKLGVPTILRELSTEYLIKDLPAQSDVYDYLKANNLTRKRHTTAKFKDAKITNTLISQVKLLHLSGQKPTQIADKLKITVKKVENIIKGA